MFGRMKNQTRAYLLALTTVGFWSTIATASKLTLQFLKPVEILFYGSLVSSVVLLTVLVIEKKLSLLLQLTGKEFRTSLGYGLLNPFLYYLVLFQAYNLLPAQQAQIINYTWAITLSLLSIPLLGQRVIGMQWLAIGISYCGVLIIATKGEPWALKFGNPLGVGLALLSTVIWAMYWILNTRDKRDPVLGLFLNFVCAIPAIALYIFFTTGFRKIPLPGLLGACYIGFFEMGIAFVFWLLAMKYTENTAKIANLIFISPFISLIFIHYFVGEEIYLSTLVGLLFVVAGLMTQSIFKEKRQDGKVT